MEEVEKAPDPDAWAREHPDEVEKALEEANAWYAEKKMEEGNKEVEELEMKREPVDWMVAAGEGRRRLLAGRGSCGGLWFLGVYCVLGVL